MNRKFSRRTLVSLGTACLVFVLSQLALATRAPIKLKNYTEVGVYAGIEYIGHFNTGFFVGVWYGPGENVSYGWDDTNKWYENDSDTPTDKWVFYDDHTCERFDGDGNMTFSGGWVGPDPH